MILFWILLLGVCTAVHGQHDHELADTWRWSSFTLADGLPATSSLAVRETEDGTLWAATGGGLCWFDGFQWHRTTGLPGAPPDLHAGVLHAHKGGGLATTVAGRVYAGDQRGFQVLPLDELVEFAAPTGAPMGFLLLTRSSRLLLWQDGAARPLAPPAGVLPQDIVNVKTSGDGTVWLRSSGSLFRYAPNGWVTEQQGMDFSKPIIDRDGRRYAAVSLPFDSRGIWTWLPGQEAHRIEHSQSDLVRDIAVSPFGQVLVIYESGDVLVIENGQETELSPGPPQLRSAHDVAYGHNGDLWVAGDGIHVHQSVVVPWQHWSTEGARNRIDEILVASDGAVWLGTDAGVEVRHPDGRIDWFDEADGQELRIVTGLGEDDQGGIWVSSGAFWDGAFRFYRGEWRFYGHEDGLRSSKIHRIERDRSGRLWFLGLRGTGAQRTQDAAIITLAGGEFAEWPVPAPLGTARIYDFAEGPTGDRFFCGVRGIGRWRQDTWRMWDIRAGLKSDKIIALAVGDEGRLSFSDQRNGLGQIDAGQIRYLDSQDGLIHDSIWDMDLGQDGTLWMATRGGLAGLRDEIWLSFGARSGLEALELWPVATDGNRVLIGSAGRGTFVLDLSSTPHFPPRLVGLDTLVSDDEAVIRWQSFAYRGGSRAQIRTRSRLDSGSWSPWSSESEVRLSDVPAGQHRLDIQARDEYGRSDEGIQIPFSIQAPYYQRPAFFIPISVSVAAALLLAIALIERRRRHAAHLAESEDRFRSFFEEAPISLWEHDYVEVESHLNSMPSEPDALQRHLAEHPAELFECLKRIRVLHVNRATLTLFGADDVDQLRQSLHRIFRRSSFDAFGRGVVAVHQGAERFSAETTVYTLSGMPLQIIMSWAVPPGAVGDYSRVLVTVLDITSQHQAAQEMRLAAQVAEEANFAKSAFLANTSHEIRTPINAIMGMAQSLQSSELSETAADEVDTILRASDALTRIIDDLLDLSKIEAGELDLEAVLFSLQGVVEDVRRTVVGSADDKGLNLTTDVTQEARIDVVGDPTRLRQVLLNLASNAIKFTAQGRVSIRISAQHRGQDVVVLGEVEDSGIGIAPDRLGDIFHPFTQADGSITRTHGGTGLGLSICRRLVEMMKGRIEVDSTPGEGSTFHFQIHLRLPTEEEAVMRPANDDQGIEGEVSPLRILLAEDNELNRKVVHALLRSDRHDLVEVENGRLALEACQHAGPFDVVLMDVQMPEMDGLTATRLIRQSEEAAGRPRTTIVALTANAMESDRERCLAAGMDDFVSKPVRKQALRSVLARVTNGDAAAPASSESTVAGGILDPQPLMELHELAELDPDFSIIGFVELFLDDTPKILDQARTAFATGDREALQRHVHTMKGSAREVGATQLSECAAGLEQRLKTGDLTGAEEGLQELAQRLDTVNQALRTIAAQETEEG